MRNPFQLSIIASTVILAGCGGSGGGPTGAVRNTVPYHTPTQINHFTPQIRAESLHAYEAQVYTKDLNNDKSEEVVVSGMDSSKQNLGFNMQVYGWNTGSFKNETKAWFTGNDNQIVGGVDVEFADFNGDGNVDMHVAGGTDTNDYTPDHRYEHEQGILANGTFINLATRCTNGLQNGKFTFSAFHDNG